MGQYCSCSTECLHLKHNKVTILNVVGAVKNTVAHPWLGLVQATNLIKNPDTYIHIFFCYFTVAPIWPIKSYQRAPYCAMWCVTKDLIKNTACVCVCVRMCVCVCYYVYA